MTTLMFFIIRGLTGLSFSTHTFFMSKQCRRSLFSTIRRPMLLAHQITTPVYARRSNNSMTVITLLIGRTHICGPNPLHVDTTFLYLARLYPIFGRMFVVKAPLIVSIRLAENTHPMRQPYFSDTGEKIPPTHIVLVI